MADTVRVPLAGWGGTVRGYALVDEADEGLVSAYRWHLSGGYARSRSGANVLYMHRLILGLAKGDGLEADHVNRDRLDNRRENLRVVSRHENRQNLATRPGRRHRGVGQRGDGTWRARVVVRGQEHSQVCATEQEAIEAAKALRAQHMTHHEESNIA